MPYHKRVITYDDETGNFIVEIPSLGLMVKADTESNGLISIKEELNEYIKNQSSLIKKLEAFDASK